MNATGPILSSLSDPLIEATHTLFRATTDTCRCGKYQQTFAPASG